MDLSFRFDRWFRNLEQSPTDEGVVHRLVLRPAAKGDGERETPQRITLEVGRGIVGDRWSSENKAGGSEVSVMNVHVLRSLAGSEERMCLSGNNLQVDLDLSEENLPVGTELHIGETVLVVSDQPHRPCALFRDRYGASAAKKVARANRIGLRGRGVLCSIGKGGEMAVGDRISVVRPQ